MAKTCNKNDSKSVPTKKGYTNKVCGIEALSKQNVKLLIIKTCGVRIRQHTLKLREQFKRKERKYSFTQWVLKFWKFLPQEISATGSKKDYRNSEAIEPYTDSEGIDENVPSKFSNPVILNTGGATKTTD